MAKEVHLIWQADTDERASDAFRAVLQRGWDTAARSHRSHTVNGCTRESAQLVVKFNAYALAALGEIEDAFATSVAMLLEDHALNAELNALRIVGASRNMRSFAAFVVYRRDVVTLGFDEIHPSN